MEHEREPFGRRERLEHDQQRDADGLGQEGVALGTGRVAARAEPRRERLGQPRPGVGLAPRAAAAEKVEADPAEGNGEPAAKVIGPSRVTSIEADPCLLDGILGLGHRAEHAVAHGSEMRPMPLELGG